MKKTYIIPALSEYNVQTETLIAASITGVAGNSGIQMGNEDAPAEADVKDGGNYFGETIFD